MLHAARVQAYETENQLTITYHAVSHSVDVAIYCTTLGFDLWLLTGSGTDLSSNNQQELSRNSI
jgi:hypothetical protein